MKKLLWLEDQYEDLMEYSSRLSRINYLVDMVKSVSEALERLKQGGYDLYIFDLKVLPGDDLEWQELDNKKREQNRQVDPNLGLELLRHLDKARREKNKLWEEITFDFNKVIVFSVVNDEAIYDELESFGIPHPQIVYKSGSNLDTLWKLIDDINRKAYEKK